MKKLFFSAIFLVAFSTVSMASTIADEEIIKKNQECSNSIETSTVLEKSRHEECAVAAGNYLDQIDPKNEMSNIDLHYFFQGYYDACMQG